jgi:hypothetical protein
MLALALAFFLQDPLEDDSIEVREAAADALVKAGEAARPLVEKRLRDATGEARARLTDVLGRIERDRLRRGFPGGAVVAGFRAALKAELGDGKLRLTVEIMNVDDQARPIVRLRHWNYRGPGNSSSGSGATGVIQVKQLSGEWPAIFRASSGCGSRPAFETVLLKPGEKLSWSGEIGVEGLNPGDFEIHVEYFASTRGFVSGATEDLKSNVVTFRVGP